MKASKRHDQFQFTNIANFDARRGYKRCKLRGVGVEGHGEQLAESDFWRNPSGHLVIRFSSQGYRFSFEVRNSDGSILREGQLQRLSLYVGDLLFLWTVEGVDDTPSVTLN